MHVRYALQVLSSLALVGAAQAGVIPQPLSVAVHEGFFQIDSHTEVSVPAADAGAAFAADYLRGLWSRTNDFAIAAASHSGVSARAPRSRIIFKKTPEMSREGYRIDVRPQTITVAASTSAGFLYGAVTLWQLLPPDRNAGRIDAQTIVDEPRYAWRGLLLDSARHYQSPAFIRSMIDWMAWHKLNVLQWHLTDDQGWRLEIKKYPRLTAVGAWRMPAQLPGAPAASAYGGFYSQQEVRDLVAFAAARHVNIVPEIDLPGHAQAAIAAYPELGAASQPLAVSSQWGVHTHLFNVEPATFGFLENVLTEVMQLFPSHEIHLGGDEVVKDEWRASGSVVSQARALGIGVDELQTYFTQRFARFLAAHGRRLIGWDEILSPGLPRDAIVMSWRGVTGARTAAIAGNDTVLAPQPVLYFDRRQSVLATEPTGRLELSTLQDVYGFSTTDTALDSRQQAHIIGLQANLWTEHMATEQLVEWMALPRAAALAELGWSRSRDWPGFLHRLLPLFARYRAFDLHYADSVYGIDGQTSGSADSMRLSLHAELGAIHYSRGTEPVTAMSPSYAEPLPVQPGDIVNAATFVGAEQASRTLATHIDARSGLRRDNRQLEPCTNAVGLLLQGLAIDIMNPCWIEHDVDLSRGATVLAAVAALPFNYELGAAAAMIRIGDSVSPLGEFQVHIDRCAAPAAAVIALPEPVSVPTTLTAARLAPTAGRHDLCFRFARPRLDPFWALAWVEIAE